MPRTDDPQTCPFCNYESHWTQKLMAHVMNKHMPRPQSSSGLGTYEDQMRDAGRGHLLP